MSWLAPAGPGGATFAVSSPIFDVTHSEAWLAETLAFGLIAASLTMLKKQRGVKDAMIAIALFAVYTAAMISVRDGFLRSPRHRIVHDTQSP